MTSSGTEAAMTALRIARAADRPRAIVSSSPGAYHGHSDGLLAAAGSGLATQGIPASPGVPAATAAATVVVPWNDPEALDGGDRAPRRRGDHRRALSRRTWASSPPRAGFLELLREQRRRVRRAADPRRGDQRLSRRPRRRQRAHRRARRPRRPRQDPRRRAAGGGRRRAARELLELLAPVGEVYQAGTLSGNPLAVAAGLATLALLDDDAYAALAASHAAARRGPARGGRRAAGQRRLAAGPVDGVLRRAAAARPRRASRAATSRPTAPGAASCSRAASTRRRRSSRPGSCRSPTARSRSSARSPPPRGASRRWRRR